jgi:hypothetical protein
MPRSIRATAETGFLARSVTHGAETRSPQYGNRRDNMAIQPLLMMQRQSPTLPLLQAVAILRPWE